MGSLLLRKSSSSLPSKKLALVALSRLFSPSSSTSETLIPRNVCSIPQFHSFATASNFPVVGSSSAAATAPPPSPRQMVRGLHISRPLAAGVAVARLPEEDEGLEISKLGIAQEVVSALARRGITQLFPIQVFNGKPKKYILFCLQF